MRKEISPTTKAPPAKDSLSEKLNKIEKLHQTNTPIAYLSNTRKATCNIMAEGFRFMPLGLVRLRTCRLSAWVT